MAIENNLYEQAKIQIELDGLNKKLSSRLYSKNVNQRVFDMYRGFDRLIYNLSRADGNLRPIDLIKMPVYNFYRHKELLEEELRPNKTSSEVE